MSENLLTNLSSIIILGISAQWLAWRLKMPSILFLLLFGFLAGPVLGFLKPDEMMGPLLLPVVSVSVAVILFEGGLTLKISEFREIGGLVIILIVVGIMVTGTIGAVAAHYLLDLGWQISILLGSILVVTGPTVIGPLLRHIRPTRKVGQILKWEGIVIDPIGALLAVLVFEAILVGGADKASGMIVLSIGKTMIFGSLIGLFSAWLLVLFFRRFWIPDFLQETVTLMMVIAAFVASNHIQRESGLFAVTLMGIALDNQKLVTVRHIIEFKENLRILVISALFIILSARLRIEDFSQCSINSYLFLAVLVLIARPLSVFLATLGSGLKLREKLFLSWMAPRGIVAAAVASIFALELSHANLEGTELLVPVTFLVIVGTVALYGFTSSPVARLLGVSQQNPQGVLFIGAHHWARAMAKTLQEHEIPVVLVDTNHYNVRMARMDGLRVHQGNVMAEHILDAIDLEGIGRMVALTSNNEANAMAAIHFSEIFDREELYQLVPTTTSQGESDEHSKHLRGRYLFGQEYNYTFLNSRYVQGAVVKATKLTNEFDLKNFNEHYNHHAIPLFLITEDKKLKVFTLDSNIEPRAEQVLIALVDKEDV